MHKTTAPTILRIEIIEIGGFGRKVGNSDFSPLPKNQQICGDPEGFSKAKGVADGK